ncbi:DUF3560 domain-containing protein [Catelliglobosispora koreensis]|uniref:DUF3560 domain-containing protein n=1 Tax=Catelliglobosispora koreensis TaxID=129052 RepID=UPI000367CF0D|nr:DUF3560 domain-containing protein [Catelliglobosispora koreensis]
MITIYHDHEDGTILLGSHRGDGVYDIAHKHGFRASRQVGVYLPGSRDRDARRHRIDACAEELRANGFAVDVTIDDQWRPAAVREAARDERADERADRLDTAAVASARRSEAARATSDRIFAAVNGEPPKPDHYNYRRDMATRQKGWAADERASDQSARAVTLSQRADAVRAHANAKDDPRAIMRRVERLKADKRAAERELAEALRAGCAQSYLDRCQRTVDRLAEDIGCQEAKLAEREAAGEFVAWSPDNLAKGDLVRVESYGWFRIARVNRKSVSLDHRDYPTKATWDQVRGRRRDGWQIDAPNATPWPVSTAKAVTRWQSLETEATRDSGDPTIPARVRAAIRLVHGLALDAADAEVAAFRPTGSEPEHVQTRRRLMVAYTGVYDRLTAGESAEDLQLSVETDPVEPLWRMPSGEPDDVRCDRVKPGDVVKGMWDNERGGRVLRDGFCGPVASVSEVRSMDYREWVTITLADGTSCDFRAGWWLAVYPAPTPALAGAPT